MEGAANFPSSSRRPSRASVASNKSLSGISRKHSSVRLERLPFMLALKELCNDVQHIFPEQVVWDRLLYHQIPKISGSQDEDELYLFTNELAQDMDRNNWKTFNLNAILLFLLTLLKRMRLDAYHGECKPEILNVMFALRILMKWMIRNLTRKDLIDVFESDRNSPMAEKHFSGKRKSNLSGTVLDMDHAVVQDKRLRYVVLVEELLQIILYLNIDILPNYQLYLESINMLFLLFSGELYQDQSETVNEKVFSELILFHFGHFANGIVVRLLKNYIDQKPPPSGGGASGLFMTAFTYLVGSSGVEEPANSIPTCSLRLLLLISCQDFNERSAPFRNALSNFETAQELAFSPTVDAKNLDGLHISFKHIYNIMEKSFHNGETIILLYLMLLRNESFRIYFLSRTDPEKMVLELLHLAYTSSEETGDLSTLYLVLDILLVLSLDEAFAKNIQKLEITSPTWYTERMLRKVSLGGLLLLIIMRIITHNLYKTHDTHIHAATIAIFCNISPTIINIETIVAQRFISLFELCAKKYQKFVEEGDCKNPSDTMIAVSDLIALIFEVVNAIVTHSLKDNTHLTYMLLQKRDLLDYFSEYPRFTILFSNINEAVEFYQNKIDDSHIEVPTVDALVTVIEKANQTWMSSRIENFSITKFAIQEDKNLHRLLKPRIW